MLLSFNWSLFSSLVRSHAFVFFFPSSYSCLYINIYLPLKWHIHQQILAWKRWKNLFRSFVDQDDSMISMRLKSVFVGQRCFSNSKLSIIEFVVFFALFSYLDAFVKHKRIASLLPRTLPFPNKNSSWTIWLLCPVVLFAFFSNRKRKRERQTISWWI